MKSFAMGLLMAAIIGTGSATAADKDAGWLSLFDGSTLSGWKEVEGYDVFAVKDGAIVADYGGDNLMYRGKVEGAKFKNFEFRADVFLGAETTSGILFHVPNDGPSHESFEAQLNNSEKNSRKTGSLLQADMEVTVKSKASRVFCSRKPAFFVQRWIFRCWRISTSSCSSSSKN